VLEIAMLSVLTNGVDMSGSLNIILLLLASLLFDVIGCLKEIKYVGRSRPEIG
jgi:hypothetical protein